MTEPRGPSAPYTVFTFRAQMGNELMKLPTAPPASLAGSWPPTPTPASCPRAQLDHPLVPSQPCSGGPTVGARWPMCGKQAGRQQRLEGRWLDRFLTEPRW